MLSAMTENQENHCANTLANMADALVRALDLHHPQDIEPATVALLWAALELQVGGPDKLARLINASVRGERSESRST
jgi:hypothetical protein